MLSSEPTAHDSSDALRPLGVHHSGPTSSERVIRPSHQGALLDRRFGLEDISALTEALVQTSRGRIERLKGTAHEVEEKLRLRVAESQKQISAAMRTAQDQINAQVTETTRRSQETIDRAFKDGFEKGEREGRDAGTRNGFETGYSEGLEKGLLEGRDKAYTEHATRLEEGTAHLVPTLESLIEQITRESIVRREAAHRDLLELAIEVAHRVIRREAAAPDPVIVEILHTAIDRIENRHSLSIEIHPDDRKAVEEHLAGLADRLLGEASITIVERPEQERGGCLVRTEAGTVDQTIETQLALIEERLIGESEVRA